MTEKINLGTAAYAEIDEIVQTNRKLVQQLNQSVVSIAEVRQKIEQITNEPIDATTEINVPFNTDFGRNLHIGKHVFINSGAMMVDLGGIYIGDHVLIGPNVTITSVNHRVKPSERRNLDLKPVCIHDNAWLGANVTVAPGVTIGENAIVAAGAVVTHDVAKNTIVAGVPARVIKHIKEEL